MVYSFCVCCDLFYYPSSPTATSNIYHPFSSVSHSKRYASEAERISIDLYFGRQAGSSSSSWAWLPSACAGLRNWYFERASRRLVRHGITLRGYSSCSSGDEQTTSSSSWRMSYSEITSSMLNDYSARSYYFHGGSVTTSFDIVSFELEFALGSS